MRRRIKRTLEQKIKWMEQWCKTEGLILQQEGECGFGRECVGVLSPDGNAYPDYYWYNEDWEQIDKNGVVWTPPNAYHKHECVAVLGRGEGALNQLFDWLVWFDANNFHYKVEDVPCEDPFLLAMGRDKHHMMVKG